MGEFLKQLEALLAQPQALEPVLRAVLKHFSSETGTLHRLDPQTQLLHLIAQTGLPPQLLDVVKTIPVGKGIAGQTVAQNRPVTICNLQADTSGVAKPGAKQTGVGGALCVPIRNGDEVVGTLGIGTVRPHEYTSEETRALEEIAGLIGRRCK
jgi:L-methionine (R)-S-oxide reductase